MLLTVSQCDREHLDGGSLLPLTEAEADVVAEKRRWVVECCAPGGRRGRVSPTRLTKRISPTPRLISRISLNLPGQQGFDVSVSRPFLLPRPLHPCPSSHFTRASCATSPLMLRMLNSTRYLRMEGRVRVKKKCGALDTHLQMAEGTKGQEGDHAMHSRMQRQRAG